MADEELRVRSLPLSITLLQSIRGLERLEDLLLISYADITKAGAIAADTGLLQPYEKASACKELDAVGTD